MKEFLKPTTIKIFVTLLLVYVQISVLSGCFGGALGNIVCGFNPMTYIFGLLGILIKYLPYFLCLLLMIILVLLYTYIVACMLILLLKIISQKSSLTQNIIFNRYAKLISRLFKWLLIIIIIGIIFYFLIGFFATVNLEKATSGRECETLKTAHNLRDICYSKRARFQKDDSWCEKIEKQGWKNRCYEEVAFQKKDGAICEKINEQYAVGKCYYTLTSKKSSSSCEQIKDADWKNLCLCTFNAWDQCANVQKRTDCWPPRTLCNDASVCKKMADQKTQNYCYEDVAYAQNNNFVCENIQSQEIRNECYEYLRTKGSKIIKDDE